MVISGGASHWEIGSSTISIGAVSSVGVASAISTSPPSVLPQLARTSAVVANPRMRDFVFTFRIDTSIEV
jgi:hypothetical protein